MILIVIEGWGLAAGCEDCFNPVFHDRIQVGSKPGFHVSELSLGSMRVTYAMSEPRSAAIQFCVSKLSLGRIQVGSKPCFHVCKNIP